MASQLFVDLYDCDAAVLDDLERVKMIAREAIRDIQAEIVEECVHKFEPIGITYIAVITTSHFSIHTWPEHNYAAIDIFSCSEQVPEQIAHQLEKAFGAKRRVVREFEREIM
nr:adenosylmethionine decarboxylase [Eubacterium sp.]